MSFPRYEVYKDSGVEWLGEVPEHWEMWKVAHAFESIGSGTTPPSNEQKWYEEGTVPWITTGELRENVVVETKKSVTEEALKKFTALRIHPSGSLAIAMYGATIGRLGILGIAATTNQACCVMSDSTVIDTRFIFYWLQSNRDTIIALFSTGGGQPNINQESVTLLRIPAPNLSDQAQISRFLDYETARIDALIAEQQRLIELLEEKRQAVISHAVTKGLDPTVPMKDSGVEWLGEVPEHWTVTKLGYYAHLLTGFPFPSGSFSHNGSDVRLLRGANVGVSHLKWDDTVYWEFKEGDSLSEYLMIEGQIIIGMDRPWIGKGLRVARVTHSDLPCLLLQRVAAMTSSPLLEDDYLFSLFFSGFFRAYVEPDLTGVSVPHLSPDQILGFSIPLPPLQEQLLISRHINTTLARLDSLFEEANTSINLLQERRSALISAAVTGKIDVRDWQPPADA